MTKDDVLERLRAAIEKRGSAQAWAYDIPCSPSYVSDILAGRREPGPLVLQALGLEAVPTYREIRS